MSNFLYPEPAEGLIPCPVVSRRRRLWFGGEEDFVLFFTFAYLSVAKGGKEQNVL